MKPYTFFATWMCSNSLSPRAAILRTVLVDALNSLLLDNEGVTG